MENTITRTDGDARHARIGVARRRLAAVIVTVAFVVVGASAPAFAVDPTSAADVYSGGSTTLFTQLLLVAGGAITAAVGYLAVRKGWKLLKSFF